MVQAVSIDSNVSGLRYAQEASLGVLPSVPVWNALEPNEYNDFGGELSLVARNPINDSRQRQKGVITDLDASGGFTSDLTYDNLQDIFQGVMFASFRKKGEHVGKAAYTSPFTAAVDDNITIAAHGFATGEGPFTVSNSGGALPTGLVAGTHYWAIVTGVNTFKVALSYALALAGTAVDITGAGSGTQTIIRPDAVVGGANDEFIVQNPAGYLANGLVLASGYVDAANNGLFKIVSVAADAVKINGNLNNEAPNANQKLVVVGYEAAAGDLDVDIAGNYAALVSSTLSFTTLGLIPGEGVWVGGDSAGQFFANAVNNGLKRVRVIAANRLTFDKSASAMVAELSTTETIRLYFGRVLKNEVGTSIVKRSYALERLLGAPDEALPSQVQSEYLNGSIPNETKISIPSADKVTVEMDFMSIDHEQRTGASGPKSGSRPTLVSGSAYNTSSDFNRIKMAVHSTSNEAPTALFAFVTDLSFSIKNNVKANKAVGVLGAFSVTAGTFEVMAEMTAYFADVAGVTAVRNNSDVTLDAFMSKENKGIFIDMPLVALGNGRLDVVQDEAIKLPLQADAATASKLDTNLNHTLLFTYFDYLPDAAM